MQIPVLAILIIFSRHAYSSLDMKEFKLIYRGWILNLMYLMVAAIIYYFGAEGEKYLKIPLWLKILHFLLDFSYIFVFFVAIRERYEFLSWFKEKINLAILYFILFSFGLFRCIYLFNNPKETLFKIVTQIPFTIFYTSVLIFLALYFRGLDKKYMKNISYLSIGIFIYAGAQILIIFEDVIPKIYFMGFTIGLISKSFITYGLHRLFLFHAEKFKVQNIMAVKLDTIIGRTFHELIRPLINLERDIAKLLDEKDKSIEFNQRARKLINLIELNHSKAHAIFNAQKKMYVWSIRDDKEIEELETDKKKKYDDEAKFISLNTLIEISRLTLKSFTKENVEFIREYSSNCSTYCNPNEMIQVFENILKNACDAFPGGMGKIFIKTTLESSEENTGKNIKIEISDNGEGIDEDIQDKIYDKGFTTRQGPGRGFGLTIVKDLVSKYIGKIKVESPYEDIKFKENLGGTKVILKLPKKEKIQ